MVVPVVVVKVVIMSVVVMPVLTLKFMVAVVPMRMPVIIVVVAVLEPIVLVLVLVRVFMAVVLVLVTRVDKVDVGRVGTGQSWGFTHDVGPPSGAEDAGAWDSFSQYAYEYPHKGIN